MITQEYSPDIQSCLVSRLAALHNFIYAFDPTNIPDDTELEIPKVELAWVAHRTAALAEQTVGHEEQNWVVEHRDTIALAMWENYQCRCWGGRAHHQRAPL